MGRNTLDMLYAVPLNLFTCLNVAIIIGFVSITTWNTEGCGQEEFNKCGEPLAMLHLTSGISIGDAKKEHLDEICHELRRGIRCIQSYTRRCMDLQQRRQFNKLYHGTNQFIKDLCNKGKFQNEFLTHTSCSKLAKTKLEKCAYRHKESIIFLNFHKNIEKSKHIKENIKTMCCSIIEFVNCSSNAAEEVCGAEAANFTRRLFNKYAKNLTKVYCLNFIPHTNICHNNAGVGVSTSRSSMFIFALFALHRKYSLEHLNHL